MALFPRKSIPRKPTPQKPTFPKSGYTRSQFRRKLGDAWYPWKSGQLGRRERIGLEKSLFPYRRYGSQISDRDIKRVQRKLGKDIFRARGPERKKLTGYRKILKKAAGFKVKGK